MLVAHQYSRRSTQSYKPYVIETRSLYEKALCHTSICINYQPLSRVTFGILLNIPPIRLLMLHSILVVLHQDTSWKARVMFVEFLSDCHVRK